MASMTTSIEVDPAMMDPTDTDYATSGYDTGSTSLSSTVNEYIFENGRRYHVYYGMDKNLLPTDETEQDRMDLHHEVLLQLLEGELHKAPMVSNPQHILDVGTGTGIWAIDMADKHPSAEVLGIDLSPLQPRWMEVQALGLQDETFTILKSLNSTGAVRLVEHIKELTVRTNRVPPNCKFQVDDAELEWTYPSDHFDFIHFRIMAQGITKWPQVLKDAYRCMKPGAYVELSESSIFGHSDDGSLGEDNPLMRWSNLMTDALNDSGRVSPTEELLRERLETAGYADVQSFTLNMPFGPWAKEKRLKKLGIMMLLMAESGFQSYGLLAFTRILGMDPNEAEKICREALAATKNKSMHAYAHHYIAIGRKPLV